MVLGSVETTKNRSTREDRTLQPAHSGETHYVLDQIFLNLFFFLNAVMYSLIRERAKLFSEKDSEESIE